LRAEGALLAFSVVHVRWTWLPGEAFTKTFLSSFLSSEEFNMDYEERKLKKEILKKKKGHFRGRNGGRPKGSKNRATLLQQMHADRRIKYLLANSLTPLEYMLRVMNDGKVEAERRDRMAAQAAKYCHPALQAITRKDGTDILPDLSNLSDEDLTAIANAKRLIGNLLGSAVAATSGERAREALPGPTVN